MKFKRTLLGNMISVAITSGIIAIPAMAYEEVSKDVLHMYPVAKSTNSAVKKVSTKKASYIVQLKGAPGIQQAEDIGELLPSNQLVAKGGNNYNADSPVMQSYVKTLQAKQNKVASDIGNIEVLHNFMHTFNGFSAVMTEAQATSVKNHPDVVNVWQDEMHQPTTANTPEFLGLNGANGQHAQNIKGEDVIIGILDTGIWPENPSFADDGTYSDPTSLGWSGTCDAGENQGANAVTCNNKLIGARYYKSSFEARYQIKTELGEFMSPRDADGHGSHTAGTAAGNEGVAASVSGFAAGQVTGMAPRARIAAYKVCWNSSYDDPNTQGRDRGCFFGDSMAAIDQAVQDGVDVLNYSIGNSNDINTPVYRAALRASQAGIFFAASAGNDGPQAATTSNIAPWVTTVGASTYDGESIRTGHELQVSVGSTQRAPMFSLRGSITADVPAGGVSGTLAVAEPVLACNAVTNPGALEGKIALIARGTCNFSTKVLNAQNAGAIAVVVYSDNRALTAMGGDNAGINIPGVMISNADGLALAQLVGAGEQTVNVTLSSTLASTRSPQTGNVMAGFSSRGPNRQSADIIKPDITAPGVQILAATSTNQMDIPGNVDGETFAYLSGTSMSGPHIAGLAALLKGEHPTWSPAAIKSALMTTSRQNVTKENGVTPADPFDFGAGHVDPVPARTPGLVYEANTGDYFGFLCGQGEEALVQTESGQNCQAWTARGFATDASQLNYPSIAVNELDGPETITRTLTDVSGQGGEYTVTVDAPAGIDVVVKTFDSNGNETAGNDLSVPANGKASFAITFTKGQDVNVNQWVFGSITLSDGQHTVRSPIAIYAIPQVNIRVPELVSLDLNRGRGSFTAQMLYTGRTRIDYAGLTAPGGITRTVRQDEDRNFSLGEASTEYYVLRLPQSKVLRFSLRDALVNVAGADLDLYVHYRDNGSWTQIGQSLNGGSNEDVILTDRPAGLYVISLHGYDLQGEATTQFTTLNWIVDGAESSTRIRSSSRAIEGRFNNINIYTRGLTPGVYMGGVTFYDNDGNAQGTTALQVVP